MSREDWKPKSPTLDACSSQQLIGAPILPYVSVPWCVLDRWVIWMRDVRGRQMGTCSWGVGYCVFVGAFPAGYFVLVTKKGTWEVGSQPYRDATVVPGLRIAQDIGPGELPCGRPEWLALIEWSIIPLFRGECSSPALASWENYTAAGGTNRHSSSFNGRRSCAPISVGVLEMLAHPIAPRVVFFVDGWIVVYRL